MVSLQLCFQCDASMLKDAQFRNSILLEIARLFKAIAYAGFPLPDSNNGVLKQKGASNGHNANGGGAGFKFNTMMCEAISNLLVNNLGFPVELSREFVEQLVKTTDRQFSKYLITLIEKYKQ
ncbi:unnamed protein product [Ambrosiozyma monospora]|uniref:Unnamed protein product n=1 Tax=Ambrosiozyma monospora TaxID=43982 RepID=A0ACB5UBH5_AMBMO|nr:unnamed protein product [Ambrosiozyma monospora]